MKKFFIIFCSVSLLSSSLLMPLKNRETKTFPPADSDIITLGFHLAIEDE